MIKKYIDIAYAGDTEILDYFDPSFPVSSVEEVCDNIYQKLLVNYPEANFEPLAYGGVDIGYFVWLPELLISFGINKSYRNKIVLEGVWHKMTASIGESFSISLFDHNTRAIKWLKRCGMKVFAEHVTILIHSKN